MKISNIKLIGLFVVLLAAYLAVDFFGGKQRSKSLRSVLVEIDSAAVTGLEISNSQESSRLIKEDGSWIVTLENGKKVAADAGSIKRSIEVLLGIKPSRLATNQPSNWAALQVSDTMGTRVKVFEGNKKSLDIILGKLGMTGQQSYHTFVRLVQDDEVYVVENFLSFSVPSASSSYRNNYLMRMKKDSLARIQLTYPGDSVLNLEKSDGNWLANGQPADSANLAKYLGAVPIISSRKYVDDDNDWSDPIYTSRFVMNNGNEVNLYGYTYNGKLVFNSSENQESYFADSTILEKVFIGPSELL